MTKEKTVQTFIESKGIMIKVDGSITDVMQFLLDRKISFNVIFEVDMPVYAKISDDLFEPIIQMLNKEHIGYVYDCEYE